ncbi:MAG: hypothetical protein SGCHY_000529 [Lobulomycetales sp.]
MRAFWLILTLGLIQLVACGEDYYKLLGVKRSATKKEIKKAYRDMSRRLHPDKNKDDPKANEKFAQLAEAYQVLTDDKKRRIYNDRIMFAA